VRNAVRGVLVTWMGLAVAPELFAMESADGAFDGALEVLLERALFQGETPEDAPAHLILQLAAEEGQWDRVWGMALGLNNAVHVGLVREGTVDADRALFRVEMKMGDDLWTRGGRAAYDIDLKARDDGSLEGTFTGTFKGSTVSGKATGTRVPVRPIRVKGFRPVAPGEHPRLLFRRSDLPGLRQKAKTPLGRAYLEKAQQSRDLISLGTLYQLSG